ncbi:MAG: putative bifunctional diguanylate cyclase/phosphodiesterase [Gammaproteobacteria bacterium]
MSEAPLTVLVVDDDDVGRERVRRYLSDVHPEMRLLEAGSVREGSRRLVNGGIDCALVDYKLGDGNAFEMLEALRGENPNFATPMILLTGAGSEEVAVRALKLGIRDYINKDKLDGELLSQAIRTVVAEHRLALAEDEHKQTLEYQSMHDELTGMANRRLFLDRLGQHIHAGEREGRVFALMNIDLDRFKAINDTLGHAAGDEVLRIAGERMDRLARRSDTYARMGGDEFAVLLSNAGNAEDAITVARRLIESLVQPIKLDDRIVQVDASVGIALYPEHGTTPSTLLAHADEAMYAAKRGAQRIAVFNGNDATGVHETASISIELPAFVEQDAVELHYQPKYALGNGELAGVEALARWRHPQLGDVPPTKFIPLVERTKLIDAFTRTVIARALGQVVDWRRSAIAVPSVAVNVSVHALVEDDFVGFVLDAVDGFGLEPADLIVEITETASLGSYDRAQDTLKSLAAAGVGISIDDFGTGYTSIRYLREFPATELKIDRLFVSSLTADSRDRSIIDAIVSLARGIGARTVAEGIESAATLELVKALGCDYGQGFFLAHPAAAEHLPIGERRRA